MPTEPTNTAIHTPTETFIKSISYEDTKITAEPIVPYLRVVSALFEENLTVIIPNNEQIIPRDANANGMIEAYIVATQPDIVALVIEAARAIQAIIDPQYDSKYRNPFCNLNIIIYIIAITPGSQIIFCIPV